MTTMDQLGEIRREFRPGMERLVAGFLIGLVLIGAGTAAILFVTRAAIENGRSMPLWAEQGHCWFSVLLFGAIGLGLAIAGVFLIRWIRSLSSFRLWVGERGFAVSAAGGERIVGWDEIVAVRETHVHERPPLLKGPAKYILPKLTSKSYAIHLGQGAPLLLDADNVKGHTECAEMIREQTEPLGIPWEIVHKQGY